MKNAICKDFFIIFRKNIIFMDIFNFFNLLLTIFQYKGYMQNVMTKDKLAAKNGNSPPVFALKTKNSTMIHHAELSYFEVKELYERAYEALNTGREDYKAKEMMALAIKMDIAYRCQLARKNTCNSTYKKPSRLNDFHITSKFL